MSLDIFQSDQTAALAAASQSIAPDLPATFAETLDNAITTGIEWHNSVASQFAKEHALRDYVANVRDMTGETLPNPGYLIGASLDDFNAKQREINEKYPVNLSPMTAEDIETMTRRRMAKVRSADVAMNARERTWGGTAGNVVGGLGASVSDPVILATLPLGGMGELGILGRSVEFGVINAGTETAIQIATHRSHEAAAPGSTKGALGEVAGAAAFGVVLGGVFGTLAKFLKAGERPLPTSVRDEVNAGASDAQINAANVFPTAEGETAGRDALVQAVTQAAKGEPVTAGNGFDRAHVAAFAESVGAHDQQALAQAGERSQRPITFGEMPDTERFPTLPIAGEDTAAYWERHLQDASPEERAALGATEQPAVEAASTAEQILGSNPAPAKTLTSESPKPGNDVSARITPTDLSPAAVAKLAEEPATYEAVQRNLDRIRLENPNAEFSTQVRQPDGSYQLVTRKLEDVLDEIDGMEKTGRELMACATGMEAAA